MGIRTQNRGYNGPDPLNCGNNFTSLSAVKLKQKLSKLKGDSFRIPGFVNSGRIAVVLFVLQHFQREFLSLFSLPVILIFSTYFFNFDEKL